MRNSEWIHPGNKKQQQWAFKYLAKKKDWDEGSDVAEQVLLDISKGKRLSDNERAQMESAWRSHLSRQKKKTKSVTLPIDAYNIVQDEAKQLNISASQFMEALIEIYRDKPNRASIVFKVTKI